MKSGRIDVTHVGLLWIVFVCDDSILPKDLSWVIFYSVVPVHFTINQKKFSLQKIFLSQKNRAKKMAARKSRTAWQISLTTPGALI